MLVLERAAEAESGGNSRFTAGAFRCVYDGVEDLKALDEEIVRNSIRYRWLEIRRELHRNLDAAGVLATTQSHSAQTLT